ncbi:extensin family protein [Sphingomonas sanguinis]|uniref:extensin-like domain-containing protein n=1 Tax=Sphingomonas sp. LC-1 TaxID=3110957 RepID=UPI0021BA7A7C|nr:extensin family protein [Sphingomonas sp. LC-1]MCT8002297.1 extensin family protein [Sphingomonas sp. LC-1]
MRALRRWTTLLVVIAGAAVLALLLWGMMRQRPQDVPWAPLDLGQPVGLFTGRKLTALTQDAAKCRGLLDQAGIAYTALPARTPEAQCGYDDAVRFASGGARAIGYRPAALGVSCPVAASLALWEWNSVQPAARALLGAEVVAIDHLGSYNCRRINGRSSSDWSEHARANAVDIAGFRLSDGRRISVVRDWRDQGAVGRFLRQVRDDACDLFATTLSPDYNAAHADHFHLDQAYRGPMGWRACR